MHFDSEWIRVLIYILGGITALLLLAAGYKAGRWAQARAARRHIAERERELFTAQKGFKSLYEQELATAKAQVGQLQEQVKTLGQKVEEYRKKAAGLGGLFNSGGKRAEAMYALLLENEALEEALLNQNQKLSQERVEALKEQMRATGYRRVLMSQIMKDDRVRNYVNEFLANEKQLPDPREASHS
jgi:chromosome segregation ATPase